MRKQIAVLVLSGACCFAAEVKQPTPAPALETSRSVHVDEKSITEINTSILETTLLVLPEGEKMVNFFGGDKANWDVRSMDVASRYIAIKPKTAGAHTSLQIITDHKNPYSFLVNEVSGTGKPYDVKVFMEADSTMTENIAKPAVWIEATDVDKYKREADAAKAEAATTKENAAESAKLDEDKFRSDYPNTLRYDYKWDHKIGDKLGVDQIWRDDKFTYIKASPNETPVLYETKDKKPSIINFTFANNLYIAGKVVQQGELVVGKQKMSFAEVAR